MNPLTRAEMQQEIDVLTEVKGMIGNLVFKRMLGKQPLEQMEELEKMIGELLEESADAYRIATAEAEELQFNDYEDEMLDNDLSVMQEQENEMRNTTMQSDVSIAIM